PAAGRHSPSMSSPVGTSGRPALVARVVDMRPVCLRPWDERPTMVGMPGTTPYEDLLRLVLEQGAAKSDRTGPGTRRVLGHQLRFDLQAGFPLVTTKRVHMRSIVHELLWFLRGESNIAYLRDNRVTIWDEWADADGELGPVYGVQWRSWPTPDGGHIDQIT